MFERMTFNQDGEEVIAKYLIEQIESSGSNSHLNRNRSKEAEYLLNLIVHVHMKFCIGNMFTPQEIKKGTKGGMEGFFGSVEETRK